MFPWNNEEADATEAAIELAEELSVDLSEVEGSGTDGRITKPDVEAFLEGAEDEDSDEEDDTEEVFPLEELDGGLVPVVEEDESAEEKFVPVDVRESEFPRGTRIVDEEMTKVLLNNAGYRFRNVSGRVAFMGYGGDQAYFALFLTSWQVRPGGVFYVPVDLADYDQLEAWERLTNEEGPEGFVAFRAP
jgi:hypothetical protein